MRLASAGRSAKHQRTGRVIYGAWFDGPLPGDIRQTVFRTHKKRRSDSPTGLEMRAIRPPHLTDRSAPWNSENAGLHRGSVQKESCKRRAEKDEENGPSTEHTL
jgi:hypothetical protein